MMEKGYTPIKDCRVCGSTDLTTYLDLGEVPLVNRYLTSLSEIPNEPKFPLAVNFCNNCSMSQLSGVVDPEIMFKDYAYRSSMSATFGQHCKELAEELSVDKIVPGELIVDIASNDGYLLSFFKKRGQRVIGIDPAENLARLATQSGIPTIPQFFNADVARHIARESGLAKIITAFNVFAHVPDLHTFVEGIPYLLDEKGYFIVESPHLQDLVDKCEFDTVYHEHASYLLARPVVKLMATHGLRIARIAKNELHGGSIRFYCEHASSPDTSDGSVKRIMDEERISGLYSIVGYENLTQAALTTKRFMNETLEFLHHQGKRVYGFGAAAKGNILLNYCGIGEDLIQGIFDDTPEKQGKYYPGVHIPIISRDTMEARRPDYLVLLPWNFKKELMAKTQQFQANGGKYIIPLPVFETI